MSPATPSRATLEDVLAAVHLAPMATRRRQDMASSVRTIARVIGRSLAEIPVDLRSLNRRLKHVSPKAMNMSSARWHNVRSLFRSALALMGPVMKGRNVEPMSDAWASLYDLSHRARRPDQALPADAVALRRRNHAGRCSRGGSRTFPSRAVRGEPCFATPKAPGPIRRWPGIGPSREWPVGQSFGSIAKPAVSPMSSRGRRSRKALSGMSMPGSPGWQVVTLPRTAPPVP